MDQFKILFGSFLWNLFLFTLFKFTCKFFIFSKHFAGSTGLFYQIPLFIPDCIIVDNRTLLDQILLADADLEAEVLHAHGHLVENEGGGCVPVHLHRGFYSLYVHTAFIMNMPL